MTRRILIPIDALDAGHPALRCARLNFPQDSLHLLHVLNILPPLDLLLEEDDAALARAQVEMQALGDGEVVFAGRPAEVILERARNGSFDLIMLGTDRKGRLERFFLGSVAEEVVRTSPLPVVTVRTHAAAPAPIRRVTVLHDFSPAAERALQVVQELWPAAKVHLLHAVSPGALVAPFPLSVPMSGSYAEQLVESNKAWKREAKARLDALGGGEVSEGEPADLALERATTGQTDLIALGTASKPMLSQLIFGSVAQRVVRESPIPVLTVHAPF